VNDMAKRRNADTIVRFPENFEATLDALRTPHSGRPVEAEGRTKAHSKKGKSHLAASKNA
jgi:hypothetical protein